MGSNLANSLENCELVLLQRRATPSPHEVVISELSPHIDYRDALRGVDVVVHAAALVHHLPEKTGPTRQEYMNVNALATERLAECAIDAGVSHFIFLSSIKVNGESTNNRGPFTSDDVPNPKDAYASSKLEAEKRLFDLDLQCDMRVSIIRAPLIYGPQVKANFSRLLRFAKAGFPFPRSESAGKRSLVSIWNLCSFISELIKNPPDESRVYMISDGSDCSSCDLVRYMSLKEKGKERSFWFPLKVLHLIALFSRQEKLYYKLFGNLQVDISKTTEQTGWVPQHDTRQGISRLTADLKGFS